MRTTSIFGVGVFANRLLQVTWEMHQSLLAIAPTIISVVILELAIANYLTNAIMESIMVRIMTTLKQSHIH